MTNRSTWLLLIVLAYAAAFRLMTLNRPFDYDDEATGGSFYGLLARNYLRVQTKLYPSRQDGPFTTLELGRAIQIAAPNSNAVAMLVWSGDRSGSVFLSRPATPREHLEHRRLHVARVRAVR